MPDSPVSATPYEVLGVPASVSNDELRVAYRRLLRETHPDTGGNSARFIAVQLAWERIGTPEDRAVYDRGRVSGQPSSWAPRTAPAGARPDTRPRARSYGHPGGWRRERYLQLMREWVGRGVALDDPYDPSLVRSAPRDIRRILADAIAEENTARTLAELGIGFTIWHDVATYSAEAKIDHVALGPTGLFALLSEDFGGQVRAKALTRAMRVKFSSLVIVLPDDALDSPLVDLGRVRGAVAVAVRQSHLGALMRDGAPGTTTVGGNELFDVRTRLQNGIRFAE